MSFDIAKHQTRKSKSVQASLLVLEDSEFDAIKIRRLVREIDPSICFSAVPTLAEFEAALGEDEFDMVVLDYCLPDGDGLEALDYLRTHPTNSAATRVMVAGDEDLDVAIAAVKNGCHGYIPKSRLNADALREAVAEAILGVMSEEPGGYSQRVRSASVEVLNGISDACFEQIKPNLARMLSELRALRQGEHLFDENGLQKRVVSIERSCSEIWHFIHEFETYREDWCRPLN